MTVFGNIQGLFRSELGDDLFAGLVECYPEGLRGGANHVFGARLDLQDSRLIKLMALLDNAGLRPWTETFRPLSKGKEFSFNLHRAYDEADLVACQLLELRACDGAFQGVERDDSGVLSIIEYLLPSEAGLAAWDFVAGYSQDTWLFSPSRVTNILDPDRLAGLSWKPARFCPGSLGATGDPESLTKRGGIPYWEVDSTIRLPPVSTTMELRDREGNPVLPGTRQINILRQEGLYALPELHYLAADLEKLPSFDVARTYENFGLVPSKAYHPANSPIVVSRKFYEICKQNGLNADFVPARVDPNKRTKR